MEIGICMVLNLFILLEYRLHHHDVLYGDMYYIVEEVFTEFGHSILAKFLCRLSELVRLSSMEWYKSF